MLNKQLRSRPGIGTFRSFVYVMLIALFAPACLLKVKFPSGTTPVTFTFVNVFAGCFNRLSGGTLIAYKGTLSVYYFNGSTRIQLNTQNFTSQPISPLTTFTVTANVPSDNTTWQWEIAIEATDCSTCAVDDPTVDLCAQTNVPTGRTAAKPMRYGQSAKVTGVPPPLTINFNTLTVEKNVANSCGCVVPN